MDTLNQYRQIIRNVLSEYVRLRYANGEIENEAVFDAERDRYLVVSVGWQGARRVHGTLVHLDIVDGKVWVQRDGTEQGITGELVASGIPKNHIVLGFQAAEVRPYTEFAPA